MNASNSHQARCGEYELRFRSLFNDGRGLTFPCDATGRVDMDSMSAKVLNNYLYARTVIGREFALPSVLPSSLH